MNRIFLLHAVDEQNGICQTSCPCINGLIQHYDGWVQCLQNYTGTSAFADVSYLTADVEAFFFIKMYWTPAKMLLLADVDEYSFANAVSAWLWYLQCISTQFIAIYLAINLSAHSYSWASRNPISIPCPVPLMSPRLVCCYAGFIRAVAVGHKFEKSLTVGYHGLLWDRIKRLKYCLWLRYHLLY